MDKVKVKSKLVYILLTLIFGTFGFQKLYARRYGMFIAWFALYCLCAEYGSEEIMFFFVFIDLIFTLLKTKERFLIYCNKKEFRGMPYGEKVAKAKEILQTQREEKTILEKISDKVDNQIAIEVPGEERNEENTHNHIKADPVLSAQVSKAQDKLDRFQNNNYFPSVDSSKTYDRRTRQDKINELRDELKSGLISKEEYYESLRNL